MKFDPVVDVIADRIHKSMDDLIFRRVENTDPPKESVRAHYGFRLQLITLIQERIRDLRDGEPHASDRSG